MLYYESEFELLTHAESLKEATDKIITNIIEDQLDNTNLYKNINLERLTVNTFKLSYKDIELNREYDDIICVGEVMPFKGVIEFDQFEYHLQDS
jgi:adenine deaminase